MKHKITAFALVIFALLALMFELTQKYHFFYIEQNQLFLFTGYFFSEMMADPGGLAGYVAEFLVQFFALPWAGAIVTSLLLTGTSVLTALICRRMATGTPLYLLWLLPLISLLCVQFDYNYLYRGTVAFLMMQAAFLLYVSLPRLGGRLIAGAISAPLLFWWCGSVVVPYALCVVIWEILNKTPRWWLSLLVVLESAVIAWGAVWFCFVGDTKFVFTPMFYFHHLSEPEPIFWLAWASLTVAIICTRLCRKLPVMSVRWEALSTFAQFAVAAFVVWKLVIPFTEPNSTKFKMLDYYSYTGQWDAIIEEMKGPAENHLYLNYLNLALAEKGILADEMFKYDQQDAMGLLYPWDKSLVSAVVGSDVHFCIGNIAIAQEMAFEGHVSTLGHGSPRLFQRLAQTNLIYGAYPVAEKYLDILDKTLLYRDWARRHREFLYDDAAVDADALLGEKRRGLPKESLLFDNVYSCLKDMAGQNPSNKTAVEYLGALTLLAKNLDAFTEMLEAHYGTETYPTLPRSFQEAVLIVYEKEPEMWERYGVTAAVIERFEEYKSRADRNIYNRGLVNIMRGSHGDTYWFYYTFK